MDGRKKTVRILWDRVFIAAGILILVILILATLIGKLFDDEKKEDDSSSSSSSSSKPDDSSSLVTINENYSFVDLSSDDIHKGDLILVNNTYAYQIPPPEDIISVYENKTNYYVKDLSVYVKPAVITNLNLMLDAFAAEKNIKNVMVNSGYRDEDYQQKLYNDELAATNATVSTLVALPGHSEHHTGFAVDFGLYPIDGVYKAYDGKGDYSWISDNCYKYGFILRYPTKKSDITKIDYEPWHFRYVGAPHAYYCSKNGICYDEYIDLLKRYEFNDDHLFITNSDETKYEVYYFKAGTTTTKLPVPKTKSYTYSGNNVDGFIVTVKL